MRVRTLLPWLLFVAPPSGAGQDLDQSRTEPLADCTAFVVSGDPHSQLGATWTYDSTDDGVRYVLEGVLFTPPGDGPFPAVVLSHGKGGTPRNGEVRGCRGQEGATPARAPPRPRTPSPLAAP